MHNSLLSTPQPMIVIEYGEVRRVWLLDDACDQPGGDWEVEWDSV